MTEREPVDAMAFVGSTWFLALTVIAVVAGIIAIVVGDTVSGALFLVVAVGNGGLILFRSRRRAG